MSPTPSMQLLKLEDLAQRLGCSTATVRRLVRAGHLPPGRKLLPEGDARRWFEQDLQVYLWRLARGEFDSPPATGKERRREKPASE